MGGRIKIVTKTVALLWLVTTAASAQIQPSCTQTVPTSVMEIDTGAVLTELHPSDFRVTLGDAPVTVLSAERDFGRRSVVLVLDVNRNIAASPQNWRIESHLVHILLESIRRRHRVGMVAFAKNGMRRISFESGREGILKWLATADADRGQLDSAPKTVGLLDALDTAVGMLPTGEFGNSVIFITPEQSYRSQIPWDVVQGELSRKVARVFGFDLMTGAAGPDDPMAITAATGGLLFAWPDIAVGNVELQFDTPPSYSYYIDRLVLGQILAPIRLELRVDSIPPAGAKWKVEILSPKNGKKRGGLYVVFPYNTPYCRQASLGTGP